MPTYQYRCTDCGRDLEVVQKFSDASLTECPTCSGALRKVFNAVGVVFKGSGFYRNDSRATSAESASESNGTDKKSSEKTDQKAGDKPSESKPAAAGTGTTPSSTSDRVPTGGSGSSSTAAKAAAK